MKTDALSYRLLRELPEAFFELIGRPAATARHYRFAAHELKDTAVRLDGLYEPIPADLAKPVKECCEKKTCRFGLENFSPLPPACKNKAAPECSWPGGEGRNCYN